MKVEDVSALADKVKRLDALLSDPHPGLAAWVAILDREVETLLNTWKGTKPLTRDEHRFALEKIAHVFPASSGIAEWAEHFEKQPSCVLDERSAPAVAWLLVKLGVPPQG